jgi:hypothetical protein
LDDPQYWRDRAEETRAVAYRITDEQARQSLFGIVRDYEALAQRALQRLAVAQQQQQVQPDERWRHKIEPSASGGFIASDIANCNGCERNYAQRVGADWAAWGTVQKVSNLILNINLYVEDAALGAPRGRATNWRKTFYPTPISNGSSTVPTP